MTLRELLIAVGGIVFGITLAATLLPASAQIDIRTDAEVIEDGIRVEWYIMRLDHFIRPDGRHEWEGDRMMHWQNPNYVGTEHFAATDVIVIEDVLNAEREEVP